MFLANENFPRPSILLLRENGIVVESIQEQLPGISDEDVIKLAQQSRQIILTFDRDYGELIFRYAASNPPAVIYFKEKGSDPLAAANMLLQLLNNRQLQLENGFTVIDTHAVRHRSYHRP